MLVMRAWLDKTSIWAQIADLKIDARQETLTKNKKNVKTGQTSPFLGFTQKNKLVAPGPRNPKLAQIWNGTSSVKVMMGVPTSNWQAIQLCILFGVGVVDLRIF